MWIVNSQMNCSADVFSSSTFSLGCYFEIESGNLTVSYDCDGAGVPPSSEDSCSEMSQRNSKMMTNCDHSSSSFSVYAQTQETRLHAQ